MISLNYNFNQNQKHLENKNHHKKATYEQKIPVNRKIDFEWRPVQPLLRIVQPLNH